jgi:hypothetical protein
LPRYLWGEAVLAATYIYERTPHSSIGFRTPYEERTKNKPIIDNIKIFGSTVYFKDNTPKYKLDERSRIGVLIGYGEDSNLYKI